MNNETQQLIERKIIQSNHKRIIPLVINNETVWIKHTEAAKKNSWHRIQNIFAKLLKLELLRSTAINKRALHPIKAEANRLKKLNSHNIHVPKVLAESDDWIVLSDLGMTVSKIIKKVTEQEKTSIIIACVTALANLHRQSRWHGRPALRDLTYDKGVVGFIDFEEDVSSAMSLHARQARDAILFFHNLVRYCPFESKPTQKAIETYLSIAPQSVVNEVEKFYFKSQIIKRFCAKISALNKREITQTIGLYNCLNTMIQHKQLA